MPQKLDGTIAEHAPCVFAGNLSCTETGDQGKNARISPQHSPASAQLIGRNARLQTPQIGWVDGPEPDLPADPAGE